MATRAYRRDSQGRFAGSGGGSRVTYGKAGGFANAAFRSRTASQRASLGRSLGATAGARARSKRRKTTLGRLAVSAAVAGGGVALYGAGTKAMVGSISSGNSKKAIAGVVAANAGIAVAAAGAGSVARVAARPKISVGARKR